MAHLRVPAHSWCIGLRVEPNKLVFALDWPVLEQLLPGPLVPLQHKLRCSLSSGAQVVPASLFFVFGAARVLENLQDSSRGAVLPKVQEDVIARAIGTPGAPHSAPVGSVCVHKLVEYNTTGLIHVLASIGPVAHSVWDVELLTRWHRRICCVAAPETVSALRECRAGQPRCGVVARRG